MISEQNINSEPLNTLPPIDAPISNFLDVRFNLLDSTSVISLLVEVPNRCRFAYIVTPNVDHIVRTSENAEYSRIYQNAWLCLNDSRILSILSYLAGRTITTVTGADLVFSLLTDTRLERSASILIVGGREGLVDELKRRFGLLRISQHRPPMKLLDDPSAIESAVLAVEAAEARFVFLAVGSPQQEVLAATIRNRGKAYGLGLCVGASFDFLTGRQRRAPVWVRRMALEWCFRLLSEPRRMWRRYLVTGPRIFAIFASDMLGRRHSEVKSGNDLQPAMSSAPPTSCGTLLDKPPDGFKA